MRVWSFGDFAIADYNNCILKTPSDNVIFPGCHFHRGIAYESKEEMNKALVDYDKAVKGCALIEAEELPTLQARAYLLRGCAFVSIDEMTLAHEDFGRVDLALIKISEGNYCQHIFEDKIDMAREILREQRSERYFEEKQAGGAESSPLAHLRKRSISDPSTQANRRLRTDEAGAAVSGVPKCP